MTAKISDSQRDALNSSIEAFGLEKTKEILTNLIDQGELSESGGTGCAYRQDHTSACKNKCFFGHLIPDEEYDVVLEDLGPMNLLQNLGVPYNGVSELQLNNIQADLHDNVQGDPITTWQEYLVYLEECFVFSRGDGTMSKDTANEAEIYAFLNKMNDLEEKLGLKHIRISLDEEFNEEDVFYNEPFLLCLPFKHSVPYSRTMIAPTWAEVLKATDELMGHYIEDYGETDHIFLEKLTYDRLCNAFVALFGS